MERGRCEWPCRNNDDCPKDQQCNVKTGTCFIGTNSTGICYQPNVDIHHGFIQNRDNVTLQGTFAHFMCQSGYDLPGKDSIELFIIYKIQGFPSLFSGVPLYQNTQYSQKPIRTLSKALFKRFSSFNAVFHVLLDSKPPKTRALIGPLYCKKSQNFKQKKI